MSIAIKNPISKRNILSSYKNRISPLNYNFINFTSQDPFHPINTLLQKNTNSLGGWVSNRYCTFPQEILIQFPTTVNLRQINILINETKIPKIIEFINCIPIGEKNKFILNNNNNSRIIPSEFMYENIGFINLSSNIESNYKARELRKIHINVNTEYIKLKIHKNYSNNLNMFCQVGIVSLEFFGTKKEIKKKINIVENTKNINNEGSNINDTFESLFDVAFNSEGIEEKFIDEKMDKQTNDKLKELIEELNKKKENEEYEECKFIKDKIDKIRKISLKIYTLEEEKKDCANKNDFDKAKELKFCIEKIKKLLDFYLSNSNFNKLDKTNSKNNNIFLNKSNDNINNRKTFMSQSHEELKNEELIEYDDIIIPVVLKKIKKHNNSFNKSLNNSGENSYDSLENMQFEEPKEKEALEELDNNLRNKYELLICFVGEDALRKIFSKFIYYKKEGFDILNIKVKDIINEQKDTSEANKYIVLLIDIIYNFLDDRHPSIVYKCLDIFYNILEAIEEKSKKSKVSYDFTITKKILNKIKEKLNDISKKVRVKASDLYCFMLDTDFCEYNTLLIELIENEVFNRFNKYLLKINKKNKYKFSPYDDYNYNNKHEIKSSKQLIITKMDIFLKVLTNFNEAVQKKKTDKQKFPKNILGDYIIMNINHPKDDVREKAKDLMIKFIRIFGNQILNKMEMVLDDKELTKIFQDKKELKIAYDNYKNNKTIDEEKEIDKDKNKINVLNSVEGVFLTNVNKKFQNKNNKNKLLSVGKKLNSEINLISDGNKKMSHSSSQSQIGNFKSKLKPIKMKRNKDKSLINSKSQIFGKEKK
jgi:centrosomal protein CEP104